jgi:hypothetical protein
VPVTRNASNPVVFHNILGFGATSVVACEKRGWRTIRRCLPRSVIACRSRQGGNGRLQDSTDSRTQRDSNGLQWTPEHRNPTDSTDSIGLQWTARDSNGLHGIPIDFAKIWSPWSPWSLWIPWSPGVCGFREVLESAVSPLGHGL